MKFGMNSVRNIAVVCGVIYFVISFLTAISPSIAIQQTAPTPGLEPMTAAQLHGQQIYVGEGCAYCHTQNVRPLKSDLVYGRPSVAGDYAYAPPELLGDHRNGPDLSNIGGRQPSAVWHSIHLWNPRAVVSNSYMPRYPWLFKVKDKADPGDTVVSVPPGFGPKNGVVVMTKDSEDLVAYLQYLKQAPLAKGSPAP